MIRSGMAAGDRSSMPGMVRASFGMYNTIADVDALIDALDKISSGDIYGDYFQDCASGEYSAEGWAPNMAHHFTLSRDR